MQSKDTGINASQLNASQLTTSKKPKLKVISNLLKAEEPISAQVIAPTCTQIPTSQAIPLDKPGKIMVHRIFWVQIDYSLTLILYNMYRY